MPRPQISPRACWCRMMASSFSCIAAVAQNEGIGYKGTLPWPRIKSDLKFLRLKTVGTANTSMENAVVMGRKTWESLPDRHRPLPNRFNIVLSSRKSEEIKGAHLVSPSLAAAMAMIKDPPLSQRIESVFVLGGERVYKEAMLSPLCDKLYITEVLQEFPADAFFPPIDPRIFSVVEDRGDPLIPQGTIEENGVKFKFTVYKRNHSN